MLQLLPAADVRLALRHGVRGG